MQPVRLADIDVGAAVVVGVEPREGNEGQAVLASVPLIDDFRLRNHGGRDFRIALFGKERPVRKVPRLECDEAGKFKLTGSRAVRSYGKLRENKKDEKKSARFRQRARFKRLGVKSLSSTPRRKL